MGDFPILIGSGVTNKNLPTLLQYADGAIVGTFLKNEGIQTKEINLKPYIAKINSKKHQILLKSSKKIIYKPNYVNNILGIEVPLKM